MKNNIIFLSRLLLIFFISVSTGSIISGCDKDSYNLASPTQTDSDTDSDDSTNCPKITLKEGSTDIPSGGNFDFGCLQIGYSKEIVFTIENVGDVDLTLSNNPLVIIDGSDVFFITSEPSSPIAAGENTSFTIKFVPSAAENKSADVTIYSNDSDEKIFNFCITGSAEFNTVINVSPNITIYFTDPPNDTALDDALIERINNQSTDALLDLCFYGLNRENVITAILCAIERGAHVRFVGNKDGSHKVSSGIGDYYEGYNRIAQALDAAFPVTGKKRTDFPDDSGFNDFILINNSIMHNKFALFTDAAGKKYLYAGTTNCTDTGFMRNNNNSLIISDDGIVETYREQFEYLLGIEGKSPVDSVRHHIIDGIVFDVLFSPNMLDGKTPMERLNELASVNFSLQCHNY